MDRRRFLKGAAALSAGLAAAGPLATQGMAATQKPAGLIPVGSVFAFLKSLTGTPTLPDEFVECNGQTLNDSQSVYDGVLMPNLNGASAGTQRFLRGSSTSGATGGSETHTHTIGQSLIMSCPSTCYWDNASTTGSTSTLPSYYEVVWVIRIK